MANVHSRPISNVDLSLEACGSLTVLRLMCVGPTWLSPLSRLDQSNGDATGVVDNVGRR